MTSVLRWGRVSSLLSLLAVVALGACAAGTEDRVRTLFAVPQGEPIDTASVARTITRDLPLGTSRDSVGSLLRARGVGRIPHTSMDWLRPDSVLVVNIDLDPNHLAIVQAEYWVGLTFDRAHRLVAVEVSRGFTGP
jgi:hypothetical protein